MGAISVRNWCKPAWRGTMCSMPRRIRYSNSYRPKLRRQNGACGVLRTQCRRGHFGASRWRGSTLIACRRGAVSLGVVLAQRRATRLAPRGVAKRIDETRQRAQLQGQHAEVAKAINLAQGLYSKAVTAD